MRSVLSLLSIVLLLTACIPESKHPLPLRADGKGDDRLIGRWVAAEEGEEGYAFVSSVGGGRYKVWMTSFDEDRPGDNPDITEMDILTTRIGGQWFMTVIGIDEPEEGGPDEVIHLIGRYDITAEDELLIYMMSWEALAQDVRAGLVAGEAEPGEYWDEVTLTADSEALAAYIAAADLGRIFAGDPLPMRRP
ncbi:MAG: hypothetical protein ABFS30_13520 [Pseudomonadota bacterium]